MTPTSDDRCKALTKSGKRCQARATPGGLCFFHANPNKASELGQKGGVNSRKRVAAENADPLPKLETATAMRDAAAQLIADVYAGKIHPRIAVSLAPLLNFQLRAIESSNLEARLARVETQLVETRERLDRGQKVPTADYGDMPDVFPDRIED